MGTSGDAVAGRDDDDDEDEDEDEDKHKEDVAWEESMERSESDLCGWNDSDSSLSKFANVVEAGRPDVDSWKKWHFVGIASFLFPFSLIALMILAS